MWHRLLLCVALTGCGFESTAVNGGASDGGGSGSDGSGSGSGSDGGSTVTGCFAHWLNGRASINGTSVQEVTELTGTGNDRHPWISTDGLRMYFTRDQGLSSSSDIVSTSRTAVTERFEPPQSLANLNSSGREGRVWLTPDELALVVSSERSGPLDIHMITRNPGQGFGSPNRDHLAMVNAVGTHRDDPFLTADGLRLYFSADSGPAGKLQLLIATRATTGADFGAPELVPGTRDNGINLSDPTLYQDERVLLYSAAPQGTTNFDLYYATRSSATAEFGPPSLVPAVNTLGLELDPALSGDGCELYFASTRKGDGKLHVFRAQVAK